HRCPPPSTMLIILHSTLPHNLPDTDCCNLSQHPGPWLAHACANESGIWDLRPGLMVPSDNWIPTVLHAIKGKILNNRLTQRAVPPKRTLRWYVS
ncbi:MAG: hypothetical protein ACKPKO_44315, partial [Candidatus Fonsibacter sp.]